MHGSTKQNAHIFLD